ncbi:MAG: P-loop NTPase [Lachnospiraceae bacterium]
MSEQCSSSDCSSCGESCPSRMNEQVNFRAEAHPQSNVKKIIAIVSGKGGVGKSLVTSMMAVLTSRRGKQAAILDADITGPSIPRAFNITQKAHGTEGGIIPVKSTSGIPVMSLNLLLEHETDPVVWRGPIIAGTVKQFWTDVIWGDVDYMFIDMPPGTGDVPLTVFQSLPVDGIIVVTTPQELVGMIVEKAVNMADMMNIPVLGIVENLSYFICPDCEKKHYIFGQSHIQELAAKHHIPVVSQLPINPELAAAADNGTIEMMHEEHLDHMLDLLSRKQ